MGLAYLAPIGAQNLFVINTALTAPLGIALVTAGIVAFFDISLALACFWGIGLVIEHSLLLQKALLGGGGLILIYLAWQLLHAQVQTDTSAYSQPTLWQTATLAFTVTWFNPQAVIDGTLMLGAFRSSLPADTASLFISGVAAASCLWFFGLTGIFKTCCQNLRPSHLQWINRICGAVISVSCRPGCTSPQVQAASRYDRHGQYGMGHLFCQYLFSTHFHPSSLYFSNLIYLYFFLKSLKIFIPQQVFQYCFVI